MGTLSKRFYLHLVALLIFIGCSKIQMNLTEGLMVSGPRFSISNATSTEGSNLTFTVKLSTPLEEVATVDFLSADGSALFGSHYTPISGTLTFAPGETLKVVTVSTQPMAGTVCAADRTMYLQLRNPVKASLSNSQASGTITDPDVPTLSITDSSAVEGSSVSFTVSLNQACGKPIRFSWATAGNTAVAGSDFISSAGNESIPIGQSTYTITVPTIDDSSYEVSETFTVTMNPTTDATLGTSSALGTITDNDTIPIVQFSNSSQTFSEAGGSSTVTISLSHMSYQNVTVPYTISGPATGGVGNDYTVASSPLIIPAGSMFATLTVNVNNDELSELDETVIISIGTPVNATKGTRDVHILTITDNDLAKISSVTSTVANGNYTSGDIDLEVNFSSPVTVVGTPLLNLNTLPANFASYVSGSGTSKLIFRYTIQASNKSSDLDYASTSSLVLSGGTITDSLKLTNANLTLPTPGTSGSLGFSKNIVINAPDAPSISSVSLPSTGMYYLGDSLNFTVAFDQNVIVSGTPLLGLNVGGSLVTASYVSGSGTSNLVFRYTVNSAVSGDGPVLVSPLNLNGGTIRNSDAFDATLAFIVPSTTGIIVDGRELILNFSTPNPLVSEASGTGRTMTVSLSAAPLTNITVPLKFGGKATKGADYEMAVTSVSFAAGQTSVNIPYDVFQDSTNETDDHFFVYADRPSVKTNLILGPHRGSRVSILDDDATTDRWKMIVPGLLHTCGITISGVLKCWGSNSEGRLGDTTLINRGSPVEIDNPTTYKSVDPGYAYTCGITTNDQLKCWGWNGYGQLGDNTVVNRHFPVQITSEKYKQVSTGFQHTCGITVNDELKCWGRNNYGQLGDGTLTTSTVPKLINSGTKYKTIAVAETHSCATTLLGEVQCWGANWYGQLGDGSFDSSLIPITVDSGTLYQSVSTGSYHTCGLTTDNTVRCWGENWDSQFGDGTDVGSPVAVNAASGEEFKSIFSADMTTCGITFSDTLKCWGGLITGIGDGTGEWYSTPIDIDFPVTYSSLSVHNYNICGVTSSAIGKCWGQNSYGQLGNGFVPKDSLAIEVDTIGGIGLKGLSISSSISCGINSSNSLMCWGKNYFGQLGDGTTNKRDLPVIVDPGVQYKMVDVGVDHVCGITEADALKCWGANTYGQLGTGDLTRRLNPTVIDGTETYRMVSAGQYYTCAVTTGNVIKCWGYNVYGNLGTGSTSNELFPKIIDEGVQYSTISVETSHTCGTTIANVAKCWGSNAFGKLGNNSTTASFVPVIVSGGLSLKNLFVGNSNTCGLTTSNVAYCWGRNFEGQVGDATTTQRLTPSAIAGGGTYQTLSLFDFWACGITSANVLRCWGSNPYGELGDGTKIAKSSPVTSNSTYTFNLLSVSKNYSCGVTTTDRVVCWGDLAPGLLGNDFTRYPFPVKDY